YACLAVLLAAAVGARADLGRWIQDIPSPSQLQAVFFRAMPLAGGSVEYRRPPRETRDELGTLIAASPSQAALYSLRAHEDELQLDFAAAENDWKKYADLSADKVLAHFELADYYHRRIQPREEIAALEFVGRLPAAARDRFTPASEQDSWKAFERIQSVIDEQALAPDISVAEYRTWVARYPAELEAYKKFFQAMLASKRFNEARSVLADYRRAFPADQEFPIHAEASLASEQGSVAGALAIYDRSFQPLWPDPLIKAYFDLLKQNHELRVFLEQARAQIASKPADIAPVARVYHYYMQSKNEPAAIRALLEYQHRKQNSKSALTADEAWITGKLLEGAHNYDEAARSYVALYSLGGPANTRRSMAALATLLLAAPDQPIHFGSGDLSYYRDIATADPGPGYLNGVLSLLFNSTTPQYQYANEKQASVSYFHRARASELISMLDQQFPDASELAALHDKLIAAYATYGDNDGVIRAGKQFLSKFPKAPERTSVALSMADAYARLGSEKEEFAVYDDLLKRLAEQADNMPLGKQAVARLPIENNAEQPQTGARSAEYARVLDRYVGRLVSSQRPTEALAIYRREIDRNPNDPGLYEKLAGFLDQNKMGADLEQVYRKAMTQFQDRTWSHKLARWYLREKQAAKVDALTRDVVKIFSGTELESYIGAINAGEPLSPALYRQVNVYAHERFPNDLVFVQNLITAYGNQGTPNPAAREKLLRTYWFYSPDLRDRFFEMLSQSGKLGTELAALGKPDTANPAAAQFVAEGEAWQSHFETAAPLFRAVADQFPGDVDKQARAASMYRSLATFDAPGSMKNTDLAAAMEENILKAAPRDTAALATVGDIFGDRELFHRAQPFWNRVAVVTPGRADGYIEAATLYWDYYQFDGALRLIADGRQRLQQPQLFSYEAGAIYENRREYARAIDEYAKGALAVSADEQSRSRLVQLSR
ncbi:MAG: hypothetical protein JO022_11320, partial [Acidobacteriaceae bacterium]|nr:hypothetical protein [Acidobacteriaceae bacterium]